MAFGRREGWSWGERRSDENLSSPVSCVPKPLFWPPHSMYSLRHNYFRKK
jgi:hypothetical protein